MVVDYVNEADDYRHGNAKLFGAFGKMNSAYKIEISGLISEPSAIR